MAPDCPALITTLLGTYYSGSQPVGRGPLVGRGPCLVGRDQGWELRICLCESRVTIHERVPSLSSGVRASATYLNDF